MNLGDLLDLNSLNFLHTLFKIFAVVCSLIYFFYSLLILKQSQVLNKGLVTKQKSKITFISLIQVVFGSILVILSIFFI